MTLERTQHPFNPRLVGDALSSYDAGIGKWLSLTLLIALFLISETQASEGFWRLNQNSFSEARTSNQSKNLTQGVDNSFASIQVTQYQDERGRQLRQNDLAIKHDLSDSSSIALQLSDTETQRNYTLGVTHNNLSLSMLHGKAENYASVSGELTGVDPYLFHSGYAQKFSITGYALDYRVPKIGHVQFGQAVVESDGLLNRRARYFEWSKNSIYARITRFDRGGEHIGEGVDLGYRFAKASLGFQSMALDNGRDMQRLRLQLDGKHSRQYWLDLSAHQNSLYESQDDVRLMFTFRTLLGAKHLASYQNDNDVSSDAGVLDDETGQSGGEKKKKGNGWKRAVFIGAGVGAAAALSSSGSASLDEQRRLKTQNEAAFDVLNDINPRSISTNSEFGGWIYRNLDGSFSSTTPVKGEAASVTLPDPAFAVPPNSPVTASYHTHGAFDPEFDNENFSPTDLDTNRANMIDGYLGTPAGQLKLHDFETDTITTIGTIATG